MHRPLHGRSLHHRPEDWLLVRLNPQEAGDLEIPRHAGVGCHRGRCDDVAQRDLRFCFRTTRRSPGQCHGCRHRPADERYRRPLAALRHRCRHRHRAHLVQGARTGLCPRYVHPSRTECAPRSGWCHQLVCEHPQQGCRHQQGTLGEGQPHRLRIHCRRCTDGCGERIAAFQRSGVRL